MSSSYPCLFKTLTLTHTHTHTHTQNFTNSSAGGAGQALGEHLLRRQGVLLQHRGRGKRGGHQVCTQVGTSQGMRYAVYMCVCMCACVCLRATLCLCPLQMAWILFCFSRIIKMQILATRRAQPADFFELRTMLLMVRISTVSEPQMPIVCFKTRAK